MKKKGIVFVVGIFIAVMAIILVVALYNGRDVLIDDISDFHYSSAGGMEIYDRESYDIHCSNVCVAKILPYQVPDEEVKVVQVSPEKMKELVDIINRYQVAKWDGFDKRDQHVLDGSSFHLSFTTKSGSSVTASGYMKWPKHYSEVVREIHSFFEDLLKEES